jgi:hypothetical protein
MTLRFATLAAAAFALTLAGAADAKRQVQFAGCLKLRWVEGRCLTILSGGTVYNLNDVWPRPDATKGLGIAGTGIADGKFVLCGGTHLAAVKWDYTKRKCPKSGPVASRKRS